MPKPRSNEKENGSALVAAILVLALLAGMGAAVLFLSTSEVRSSNSDVQAKQVFYLAEAGMEAGRATLRNLNGAGPFTDDLTTYAGADGVLDFDPSTVQVSYDVLGNVTGLTGYDDDVPLIPVTSFGDGWYAAFMTNDPVNGTSPSDTNDRVVITGIGMSKQNAVEIVQSIVTREILIPPAAITLLGPSPSFVGGHSNPKTYVGEDCAGSGGQPGLYVPVIGLVSTTAESLVETAIENDPAYTSGSYTGHQTAANLTDPGDPMYNGPIDALWTDCEALRDKIEAIRVIADVVCTDGNSCTLPASSPDRVIFIDDDYALNDSGEGTIVVTGAFTTNGAVSWAGQMWAVGEGYFRRNGGGSAAIDGTIVIADIAGPDGVYGNSDDCSGGVDGFGSASFDENGGGNGTTTYCTDDIVASNPAYPYEIVEFRQH
ncbi:MAG: hypothetical protein GTN89_03610 [Acidobacteria bacterium]|nr:hypothetical protein [Acidobacteriota bacterium]NIM63197.1 hypothetical protein [Acidobacteriota bacterium]NIO58418.1 hypothetical protein [Acidobacteriota bacterium]NIQ29466.1 hypothetical protein [Acidobacteriota bacterium]NIQ84118.1 hypothetical protein [Acidobacteriota bacterium]